MLTLLLGLLGDIKRFFSYIFEKLGITGTIIVVLLIVCGIEYNMINNRNVTIKAQETTIVTLSNDIKLQNASIEASGKKYDELKVQLTTAQKTNLELAVAFGIIRENLNRVPIATTCDGAMNEVRQSAKDSATQWNKK